MALRQKRLDAPGLKPVSGVLLEYPKVRYLVHNSLTFVLPLATFVMGLINNPLVQVVWYRERNFSPHSV